MPVIQSILFKKPITIDPREWLKEHNYKYKKIDETPQFYRFRQHDPQPLEATGHTFRTIPFKYGDLIVAYPPKK